MAISKKGSRKIIVEGVVYLFKVSKIKKKSDWRVQEDELDATFMNYARYYGLGKVKDITINIVIQLLENPVSSMFVKCHTVLVDGFMGAEQVTQIKPKLVSQLIINAIKAGWNPSKKGDFRVNIVEKKEDKKAPVILQLPNMNEDVEDYENIDQPIEVKIERPSGEI